MEELRTSVLPSSLAAWSPPAHTATAGRSRQSADGRRRRDAGCDLRRRQPAAAV